MTQHINKTCRVSICTYKGYIYCSTDVIRELRDKELIVQLGQKYFPVKGKTDVVIAALQGLSQKWPDHFANSAFLILGVSKPRSVHPAYS